MYKYVDYTSPFMVFLFLSQETEKAAGNSLECINSFYFQAVGL